MSQLIVLPPLLAGISIPHLIACAGGTSQNPDTTTLFASLSIVPIRTGVFLSRIHRVRDAILERMGRLNLDR